MQPDKPRWIRDLYSLNRRGWELMREAGRADIKGAALQYGVSRCLIQRVIRLPPESIHALSAVPMAQFVPVERDRILEYLVTRKARALAIGATEQAQSEREFNLHYWHTMRAQAESDPIEAAMQFSLSREIMFQFLDVSIDEIEALVLQLRPDHHVVDVKSLEAVSMLIEADASEREVQHLLLCATTALPIPAPRDAR